MKKGKRSGLCAVLAAVVFCCLLTPVKTAYAAANPLVNPGFENGTKNWSIWGANKSFKASADTSNHRSGKKSLKLTSTNAVRATVKQNIKLSSSMKGKYLTLSQWTKTSNLSGETVDMVISFLDSKNKKISDDYSSMLTLKANENWKQSNQNFFVPSNTAVITVEYLYNAKGTIWIDDISLQPNNNDINVNVIRNGNFETSLKGIANNWSFYGGSNNVKFNLDTSNKQSSSVKCTSTVGDKDARAVQSLLTSGITKLVYGKSAKFKYSIKSSANNTLYTKISYLDKSGKDVINPYSFADNLYNNGWKQFEKNIEIPNNSNISQIKIDFTFKNLKGSTWVDDVSLEPYTKVSVINSEYDIIELSNKQSKKLKVSVSPTNADHKSVAVWSVNSKIAKVSGSNVAAVSRGVTTIKLQQKYQNMITEVPVLVNQGNSLVSKNKINNLKSTSGNCISGKVQLNRTSGVKYSMLVNGKGGTMKLASDGSFKYYITDNFIGNDYFAIKAYDAKNNFAVSVYKIAVSSSASSVTSDPMMITMNQNEKQYGRVYAKSSQKVTFALAKKPSNGWASISTAGNYTYIPNKGFTGYDSFDVKMTTADKKNITVTEKVYVAPSISTLKAKFNSAHPRIMSSQSDFERMKDYIENDDNVKVWYSHVKQVSDEMLSKSVVSYTMKDSTRLNTESKAYIESLSFMYKVTGDEKYAERAKKELLNICSYKDWNDTKEFLNTAELSAAAAIGYDYLYDYMSQSERDTVKNAIKTKALDKAVKCYDNKNGFTLLNNNWSIVCNSSMIMSALSIADGSDYYFSVVQKAMKSMQTILPQYYKDGSCSEGPTYFEYATQFLMYGISSIKSALNMDNPFKSVVNMKNIASYSMYVDGSQGQFNYADSSEGYVPSYINMWASACENADLYTEYCKIYHDKTAGNATLYDIMWYKPQLYCSTLSTSLDKSFDSNNIVSMRSSFTKDNAVYAAFKGGLNNTSHGDLDIGTFVYDALGERWAMDMGIDNYNGAGYFDSDKLGQRWTYYKKNTQGHNTLTIGNSNQVVGAEAKITAKSLNAANPYAVLDMTPAYKDKAVSVTRKYQLLNSRKDFTVEDNFDLRSAQDVKWQLHTDAAISISSDGKTATLTKNDKSVKLTLSTSTNFAGKFQQCKSNGVNVLSATASKVTWGKITVKFTPTGDINSNDEIFTNGGFEQGLDKWNKWQPVGNWGAVDMTVDSSQSYEGSKSLNMKNSTSDYGRATMSQTVNLSRYAGRTVKVKMYVKTSDFTPIRSYDPAVTYGLTLRYRFADHDNKYISENKDTVMTVDTNQDWKPIELTIDVPSQTKMMDFTLLYGMCKGNIWIDSVQCIPQ